MFSPLFTVPTKTISCSLLLKVKLLTLKAVWKVKKKKEEEKKGTNT